MATARQHHYVQARYLDGFLAPGSTQLVCYGRGRSKPHRSIPDGIATQRDFYAIPNRPPDANIENFLETKIERPGLDALRRLVENRTPPSLEDRVSLSRYIAFQEMRVPYSRELNREHMRQSLEEKGLAVQEERQLDADFSERGYRRGYSGKALRTFRGYPRRSRRVSS